MRYDVVVTCREEEVRFLGLCLDGIRENVPGCARVFVVGSKSSESQIRAKGGRFVDWDGFIPGLEYNAFEDKNQWWPYYSGALRLEANKLVSGEHYLAIGANLVFLRKLELLRGGVKPVYHRAMPTKDPSSVYCMFRTDVVASMLKAMGKGWWQFVTADAAANNPWSELGSYFKYLTQSGKDLPYEVARTRLMRYSGELSKLKEAGLQYSYDLALLDHECS